MVDVAGIDHVCIGTDTKLTPPYNSANGKGADKKESPDKPQQPERPKEHIGEQTNGAPERSKGWFCLCCSRCHA